MRFLCTIFSFLFLFCLPQLILNADENVQNECRPSCDSTYLTEFYASMAFGKSIGVNKSYSTFGTWVASEHDDYLYYLDGNWNHLSSEDNGLNTGIGIRFGDEFKGCGANLYYDYRRYHSKNFNQMSCGLEGWIDPWEFHFNAYLPMQSTHLLKRCSQSFEGGFEFSSKKIANSCQLATLLVGRRFEICNCCIPALTCVTSLGPYWVSNNKDKNKVGGIANIVFRFRELLSLNISVSHDSIFNTRVLSILSINIPLCNPFKSTCDCGNTPSIYRSRPQRFDLIAIDSQVWCRSNWSFP